MTYKHKIECQNCEKEIEVPQRVGEDQAYCGKECMENDVGRGTQRKSEPIVQEPPQYGS